MKAVEKGACTVQMYFHFQEPLFPQMKANLTKKKKKKG